MRWWWIAALAAGCSGDIEGDTAGECEDGADNDRDGLFDCLDDDCAGAPACNGEDTVVTEESDPPVTSDDSDPPATPTACATGWNGSGDRPPGPHPSEVNLVSAWLIDPSSFDASFNAACVSRGDPDWDAIFDPSNIVVPDQGYNYTFYEVGEACEEAVRQRCGAAFPGDCRADNETVYARADELWEGPAAEVEGAVDALLAPGCTLHLEQTPTVLDEGTTGKLVYTRVFTATPSCPGSVRMNNNCRMTWTYDLSWVRAE